jgi:hypothetical protein
MSFNTNFLDIYEVYNISCIFYVTNLFAYIK